jgi:hypothetical protein
MVSRNPKLISRTVVLLLNDGTGIRILCPQVYPVIVSPKTVRESGCLGLFLRRMPRGFEPHKIGDRVADEGEEEVNDNACKNTEESNLI